MAGAGRWPDAAFSRTLGSIHFAAKNFTWIGGAAAIVIGVLVVAGICALLYRAGRSAVVRPVNA